MANFNFQILRTQLLSCLIFGFLFAYGVHLEGKPNVIIIYTDDQGTVDLGCYGSDDLFTPHIDSLARDGIRLTNMYSPSAICSASRAGMLTGKIPFRAGVPSNVSSQPGVSGMPSDEYLLSELFKDNGYTTAHIGKWHLGYSPQTMPNAQGFDYSYGHMGGCIDNYSHFFYWNGPNRHDLWRNGKEIWEDGQFFGSRMVEEMQSNLHKFQKTEKPFFIYWAINFPHYPLQGTAKWRNYYQHLPAPRNMYNAFVSTMDEMIGDVLGTLKDLGLKDDTIIIFQSDHGHSLEVRTFGGGGSSGPYRGCKGNFFEGGLKVPSIISWPGSLPKGKTNGHFATGSDWFPTLIDLCELDVSSKRQSDLDGKSIANLLQFPEKGNSPHEHFYWQLGSGNNAQWVVRKGDWKLLGNARDPLSKGTIPKLFLVNLSNDIAERTNLAEKEESRLNELIELKKVWDSRLNK